MQLTTSGILGQVVGILGRYSEQVEVVLTDPKDDQGGMGIWQSAKVVTARNHNAAQHQVELSV